MAPAQIASEYDLPEARVKEALAFYDAHRAEVDAAMAAAIAAEQGMEEKACA